MMFVQAIEGRVVDPEGLRRQLERWMSELRPGAQGFLGSTAGLTDGGDAVAFARFDTAAHANGILLACDSRKIPSCVLPGWVPPR